MVAKSSFKHFSEQFYGLLWTTCVHICVKTWNSWRYCPQKTKHFTSETHLKLHSSVIQTEINCCLFSYVFVFLKLFPIQQKCYVLHSIIVHWKPWPLLLLSVRNRAILQFVLIFNFLSNWSYFEEFGSCDKCLYKSIIRQLFSGAF